MNARVKLFSTLGLSVAVLSAAALAFPDETEKKAEQAAKLNEPAPAWTLKDIKGKEWKSAEHEGKIVVLEWVNPQCPVCKKAHTDGRIPNMVKELKALGAVHIAVNSTHNTDAEQNEKALKEYGIEYPVLLDLDGKVGKAFGARTTPHMFVIDTAGVLRYSGALDNNARGDKSGSDVMNYAINAVKQIKAGESVTPEYTQPYGCSVKYANPNKGNRGEAAAENKDRKENRRN